KRPLLARRGFQIGLLIVVIVGAGLGIWYGLAKEHSRNAAKELRASERTAMSKVQATVDGALSIVGQANGAGSFTAFATLHQDVDGFAKGSVKAGTAGQVGDAAAGNAKK